MPEEITHLESIKLRIRAVDMLRLLKNRYTYEELSALTHLPITVLNRYVKGHVLPSHDRAEHLTETLSEQFDICEEIERRIKFNEQGYFDNTRILGDILLLERIGQIAYEKFHNANIDKVLTAAADGIPLATQIADKFGVDMTYAKMRREVGVHEFLEENYIPSSTGVLMSLYIPIWMIKQGENVLVVDDVVRSGETQRALLNLVQRSKANVSGVFVIIAIGREGIRAIRRETNAPVEALVELPEPK